MIFGGLRKRAEARARRGVADRDLVLVKRAICQGVESVGPYVWGGILVLSRAAIVFEHYWPYSRRLEIPLGGVSEVSLRRLFLYRPNLLPVLVVAFQNRDDEMDEVGWCLRGAEGVASKIEELRRNR